MTLFERHQLAQAFKLPLWGQAAEEQPPQWLVGRIQSGDLVINPHGGFNMLTPFGIQSCIQGDIILLYEDDTIEFCKPDTFAQFEAVEPLQLVA